MANDDKTKRQNEDTYAAAASARRKLKELAINDSGFVFDPQTGATFSVNPTGQAILQALKQGAGREQITDLLQCRFNADGHDLQRDVDGFVHLLRTHQLLPADFAL
jgi:hypothetical protein